MTALSFLVKAVIFYWYLANIARNRFLIVALKRA